MTNAAGDSSSAKKCQTSSSEGIKGKGRKKRKKKVTLQKKTVTAFCGRKQGQRWKTKTVGDGCWVRNALSFSSHYAQSWSDVGGEEEQEYGTAVWRSHTTTIQVHRTEHGRKASTARTGLSGRKTQERKKVEK